MSDQKSKTNEREVGFRGAGFNPRPMAIISPFVFIGIIALIEWGTRTGWITNLTLPRPSDVYQTFIELYQSGLLYKHVVPSLTRLFFGSLMGITAGIGLGILIGLFTLIRA